MKTTETDKATLPAGVEKALKIQTKNLYAVFGDTSGFPARWQETKHWKDCYAELRTAALTALAVRETEPAPAPASGMTMEERMRLVEIETNTSKHWSETREIFRKHLKQAVAQAVATERENYKNSSSELAGRINSLQNQLQSERERHAAELANVRADWTVNSEKREERYNAELAAKDADIAKEVEYSRRTCCETQSRLLDVATRIGVAANPGWVKGELERLSKHFKPCNHAVELSSVLDPPICRLQFPDGTVPGNIVHCAEGWRGWYEAKAATLRKAEDELQQQYQEQADNDQRWQERLAKVANDTDNNAKVWEEEARRYDGNADFWREQHQQARKLALEENAKAVREAKADALEEAAVGLEMMGYPGSAKLVRQLAAAEKPERVFSQFPDDGKVECHDPPPEPNNCRACRACGAVCRGPMVVCDRCQQKPNFLGVHRGQIFGEPRRDGSRAIYVSCWPEPFKEAKQ